MGSLPGPPASGHQMSIGWGRIPLTQRDALDNLLLHVYATNFWGTLGWPFFHGISVKKQHHDR
jgi:hypothetical protein